MLCQHFESRLNEVTATTAQPRFRAVARTTPSSGRPRQWRQRGEGSQKSLPWWLQPCATNSTPLGFAGTSHSVSRSLMTCRGRPWEGGGRSGGEEVGRRERRTSATHRAPAGMQLPQAIDTLVLPEMVQNHRANAPTDTHPCLWPAAARRLPCRHTAARRCAVEVNPLLQLPGSAGRF